MQVYTSWLIIVMFNNIVNEMTWPLAKLSKFSLILATGLAVTDLSYQQLRYLHNNVIVT